MKETQYLFVIVSTASSRACRVMSVRVVLIDELSQIKKVDIYYLSGGIQTRSMKEVLIAGYLGSEGS